LRVGEGGFVHWSPQNAAACVTDFQTRVLNMKAIPVSIATTHTARAPIKIFINRSIIDSSSLY
jgi:hypothetical protein